MTREVLAIVRTTAAEAVRRRILYVVFAFAIGLILLSAVMSTMTLGWQVRVVTDLSLTAVNVCGTAMALLLGVSAIARELELRTVVPVIAKPIGRMSFLFGKFGGVALVVTANTFVMWLGATALIAAYSHEGAFQYSALDYGVHFLLLLTKLWVVTAVAVCFSTVASSTVGLVASAGVSIAGYFVADLRFFLAQSDSLFTRWTGEVLYRALPDFSLLDTLARLVHGHPVVSSGAAWAAAYALCYALTFLLIASAAFSRKDLG